jgi:hypothetical protein
MSNYSKSQQTAEVGQFLYFHCKTCWTCTKSIQVCVYSILCHLVVILPETSFLYLFSFIGKLHVFATNSIKFAHFSVVSPFQRFIPISAFYPHFSVLSPFQRFTPISAFYPHFSVLSPFQFPLSVSVSAIQFQRFIPTLKLLVSISCLCSKLLMFTSGSYDLALLAYLE